MPSRSAPSAKICGGDLGRASAIRLALAAAALMHACDAPRPGRRLRASGCGVAGSLVRAAPGARRAPCGIRLPARPRRRRRCRRPSTTLPRSSAELRGGLEQHARARACGSRTARAAPGRRRPDGGGRSASRRARRPPRSSSSTRSWTASQLRRRRRALGRGGLVGDTRRATKPGVAQRAERCRRAGQRVARPAGRSGDSGWPDAGSGTRSLRTPSRSRKTARRRLNRRARPRALPVPGLRGQLRVGDERVPDDRLERLDERRLQRRRRRRRRSPTSASSASAPPGCPTTPKIAAPTAVRELDRVDEVDRDVVLARAAADREDEERVARAQPRDLQPGAVGGLPALVVGAGGQLGDVVGRRVALDARRACGSR